MAEVQVTDVRVGNDFKVIIEVLNPAGEVTDMANEKFKFVFKDNYDNSYIASFDGADRLNNIIEDGKVKVIFENYTLTAGVIKLSTYFQQEDTEFADNKWNFGYDTIIPIRLTDEYTRCNGVVIPCVIEYPTPTCLSTTAIFPKGDKGEKGDDGACGVNTITVNDKVVPIDENHNASITGVLEDTDVEQILGQSTTSILSQKVVTDELLKKVDKTNVEQILTTSTEKIPSSFAVSTAIDELKVYANKCYLVKSTDTLGYCEDDKPIIAPNNYLTDVITNTEIDWNGDFISLVRNTEGGITFDNKSAFDISFDVAVNRNANIEIGAKVYRVDVFGTETQISSALAFGLRSYTGDATYTEVANAQMHLTLDLLTSEFTTQPNEQIRFEIYSRRESNVNTIVRIYAGANIGGTDRFSYVNASANSIKLDTNQIANGAITPDKLSQEVKDDIDSRLIAPIGVYFDGQVPTWVEGVLRWRYPEHYSLMVRGGIDIIYDETTAIYTLNGVNHTYEEIIYCYQVTNNWGSLYVLSGRFAGDTKLKTIFPFTRSILGKDCSQLLLAAGQITKVRIVSSGLKCEPSNATTMFLSMGYLTDILGEIGLGRMASLSRTFNGCVKLTNCQFYDLHFDISFVDSPLLSEASILHMIQNASNTSSITITLHQQAYDRLSQATKDLAVTKNINLMIA